MTFAAKIVSHQTISLSRLSLILTELISKLRDLQWIIPNVYILSSKTKSTKLFWRKVTVKFLETKCKNFYGRSTLLGLLFGTHWGYLPHAKLLRRPQQKMESFKQFWIYKNLRSLSWSANYYGFEMPISVCFTVF